ncbi:MAG: GRP family sugar transporter [Elusimicrobiota bacterium]
MFIYSILCILAAVFWTLAMYFGKIAMRDTTTVGLNTIRFIVFVVLIFIATLGIEGLQPIEPRMIFPIFMASLTGWIVGATLYFYVLKLDSLHRVGPVSSSSPVWTVVLAVLFLHEKLTLLSFLALLCVITGLVIMTMFSGNGEEKNNSKSNNKLTTAVVAMIGAVLVALSWGSSTVFTKYVLTLYMPFNAMFYKAIFAVIGLLILSYFTKPGYTKHGVVYSIISGLCLITGEIFFMVSLKNIAASQAALLTSSMIPFTFIIGMLFLGEKPTVPGFVSMLFFFTAVVLVAL